MLRARVRRPSARSRAFFGIFKPIQFPMHFSRSIPLFILTAAALARGQAPATPPPPVHDKTVTLDAMIVSTGPDAKTAFDLAQGSSILAGEELHQRVQATLGETLSATPGVNSTYYGPGASRPVIRGLGGDRIRVLSDSVGTLDVSNVSPDHATSIEPLFAESIEVLRGPSALLYGGSAIGGVVNVIENRIPSVEIQDGFSGVIEARAFGPANERSGIVSLQSGKSGLAFRINALRQQSDDMDIPGVARIDPDAPADQPRGTLPNTAIDTWSGSLGATAFGTAGRIGASIGQYDTDYGVPGDEQIGISLRQTRFDLAAEVTQPFGIFRAAKARIGYGRYRHSEHTGEDVHVTFRNRATEGRLELLHQPVGIFTGTLGFQGSQAKLEAVGEEVVMPGSRTENGAIFLIEDAKFGSTALQIGARVEHQKIKLGEVDPDLTPVPGYTAESGQKNSATGFSVSSGLVFYPAPDWSVGLALSRTERLPTVQELFSHGPHGGTGSYEVGSSALGAERSLGADLSIRKRAGFATGMVGVFANWIDGYIFEQELPDGVIPEAANPEGLRPLQFVARDARFYGGEAEISFHLIDEQDHHVHLNVMADAVRAKQDDGTPLPRIPPFRAGIGLRYDDARWNVGIEVQRAFRQNRATAAESITPAYTLVHANADYLISAGRVTYTLFAHGRNLTNETARVHTSFLKDFAPLPGRGVVFGVRAEF